MRIGFVTCVQLGLSCMEEIDAEGGKLDAVLTLPDHKARAKSGRVYLDGYCAERGIPLAKFDNMNDADAVSWLRAAALDWLFVVGWSQIATVNVLASVSRGAIGMHPTLLPEGRGRAAVPWTILKGLAKTGVSMFKLDSGVDTGPLLAQQRVDVDPRETATTLYRKIELAHRALVRRTWAPLCRGTISLTPQDDSRGTVWPGRSAADGRLDPAMSVAHADRLIRAVTRPYPGAFLDQGLTRLRIWSAVPAIEQPAGAVGMRLRFADGDLIAVELAQELVPG